MIPESAQAARDRRDARNAARAQRQPRPRITTTAYEDSRRDTDMRSPIDPRSQGNTAAMPSRIDAYRRMQEDTELNRRIKAGSWVDHRGSSYGGYA